MVSDLMSPSQPLEPEYVVGLEVGCGGGGGGGAGAGGGVRGGENDAGDRRAGGQGGGEGRGLGEAPLLRRLHGAHRPPLSRPAFPSESKDGGHQG